MKKSLLFVLLFLGGLSPLVAEILWSEQRDFYLDPPEGWRFLEDPSPEHFVMTDGTGTCILEIFNQDTTGKTPDPAKTVVQKAKDIQIRLKATGDGESFSWGGQEAWLGDETFQAGPIPARGWFLVTKNQDSYLTALAYSPTKSYDEMSDLLISALNSLALGEVGRKDVGPMSAYFRGSGSQPSLAQKKLTGLPTPFTMTYDKDVDESVQTVLERESRIMVPYIKTKSLNAAWSRFYRQIYREIYSSLLPLSQYWISQVRSGAVKANQLPQTIMTWIQKFEYSRKGDLTDISTPWQTLSSQSGDCDSRSLLYLALMEQTGTHGILMVSATYSHAMAALDLPGDGARFPMDGKNWLIAELTDSVNLPPLGMIAKEYADPNQWLGIDLWGKP